MCRLAESEQKKSEDALESVSDDEDELIGDAGEWAGINRCLALPSDHDLTVRP